MGDGSLAALHIDIGADVSGAVRGLNSLNSVIDSTADGLKSFGMKATLGLTLPIVAGFTAVIAAASNTQSALTQLDTVLDSTGGKAGVTEGQAVELAGSLSNITRYSFEATLSAENLLLTFTNISGKVFPDAIKTTQNMSAALGQDLKSSAIQLGKALQDPIKGVSALQRVGVEFTTAQKAMIKHMVQAGDVMGAQKLILQELNTEFGNSAEAAGTTFAGKLDILGNKFTSILSIIGGPIIDVLSKFIDGLIGVARGIEDIDPNMILLAAGAGAVVAAIGPLATVMGVLLGPIGAVAGAVVALKLAFDNNFMGIRDIVTNFEATIQPTLDRIKGIVSDFINNLFPPTLPGLPEEALAHLSPKQIADYQNQQNLSNLPFLDRLVEAIKAAAPKFISALQDLIGQSVDWLVNVGVPSIVAAVPNVIAGFSNLVGQVGSWIETTGYPAVRDAIAGVFHIDSKSIDAGLKTAGDLIGNAISGLWSAIQGPVSDFTNGLSQAISTLSGSDWSGVTKVLIIVGGALAIFAGLVGATALGVISGIGKALPSFASGIKLFIDALASAGNGDIGGMMTKVGVGISQIAQGLSQIPLGIAEQVGKLLGINVDAGLSSWNTVGDSLKQIWNQIVQNIAVAVGRIQSWMDTVKQSISKSFNDAIRSVDDFINELKKIIQNIVVNIQLAISGGGGNGSGNNSGSGGGNAAPHAFGGDVTGGSLYKVGEGDDPELLMIPGSNGRVIPNAQMNALARAGSSMGSGSGGPVTVNLVANGVSDPIALVRMIDQELWRRGRQKIGSDW